MPRNPPAGNKPGKLADLHDLCSKHNVLDLYLWLAHRFPETFPDQQEALAQKERCIALVAAALESRKLQLPEAREKGEGAGERDGRPAVKKASKPAVLSPKRREILVKKAGGKKK